MPCNSAGALCTTQVTDHTCTRIQLEGAWIAASHIFQHKDFVSTTQISSVSGLKLSNSTACDYSHSNLVPLDAKPVLLLAKCRHLSASSCYTQRVLYGSIEVFRESHRCGATVLAGWQVGCYFTTPRCHVSWYFTTPRCHVSWYFTTPWCHGSWYFTTPRCHVSWFPHKPCHMVGTHSGVFTFYWWFSKGLYTENWARKLHHLYKRSTTT